MQKPTGLRRWSNRCFFLCPLWIALVFLRVDPLYSFSTPSSRLQSDCVPKALLLRNEELQRPSQLISLASRRRNSQEYYDDDYFQDNDDEDEEDNNYYASSYYREDDEEDRVQETSDNYYEEEKTEGRGGYYQVSFNEEVDPAETEIDWEVCYNESGDKETPQALVLLPPAAVDRPKAIVHFVGGTFFGSNPKIWYRSLLEAIVRNTSVAIVVTPIPVTLFQNPLEHVRLSRRLQRSFRSAWTTILEDEYGSDGLEGVPLCGMGHSLGARLLTVMTTLDKNKAYTRETKVPPYKSFCLISFTNYGAKVGIPGVGALLKQSKKREARSQSRTRRTAKPYNGRKYDYYAASGYDAYDDDEEEDYDEEWAELVEDFQETVAEQANRLQTALTPKSKDLEFFPTPDKLWKALGDDGRYDVNTTLIVQFDDDPIDQGSKLATLLHSTNSSDVRFARLRGNHLTPVSATTTGSEVLPAFPKEKRLGSLIEKTLKGNQQNKRDKIALRDLRLSLVSYLTDVVTKE